MGRRGHDDVALKIDTLSLTANDSTARAVQAVPLFSRLRPAELESVLAAGERCRLAAGDALFHQGDPADRLFVVLKGALRVYVTDSGGDELELATIGPGDFVGEVALLDGGPRSATVISLNPAELFALTRPVFIQLLRSSPGLLSSVLENLTRTVRASAARAVDQELRQRVLRADMELARHRALIEMVAGVADQINTPLAVVRSAASLLRNRMATGNLKDADDASALIERNLERAHRLLEEFKTLSASQISDTRESLDLVAVVGEVVELFSISARAAGLHIVVRNHIAGPGRPTWIGYRGRLAQVLLNLLTNVQRHAYPAGAGGEVELGIAADDVAAGGGFVLTLRDFGRGIAPEDVPRVFDPAFTTGRALGGTGLGLAIVRGLVRDGLGGSVQLTSTPGQGTTIVIRLPRSVEDPPA
ncbi:MAG TPA: ATP-binding protein [Chloroflexota bacterium]|nr:ATP-binding protein [Chloroflexota bacterium]